MDFCKNTQPVEEVAVFHSFFEKAIPETQGDRRFVRCEASNQNVDLDEERVMQKALKDSREYFLRKGNVDIDHITKIGYRLGIEYPHNYEIGLPVAVDFDSDKTMVRCEIFRGEKAKMANDFWASITEQLPPSRWFPSVAGNITKRDRELHKGKMVKVVEACRWNNLAFAKEPINHTVGQVEQVTKSISIIKTLGAGDYTTDVQDLSGGEAVREESLDGKKKRRIKNLLTTMRANPPKGGLKELTVKAIYWTYRGFEMDKRAAFEAAQDDYLTIHQWRQNQ